MDDSPSFTFADHRLALHHERAASFIGPDGAPTLLIADPHLGKPGFFRSHGIPVPEAATGADLARLTQAIRRSQARRLIVLGDLFHGPFDPECEPALAGLRRWREAHPDLLITLVRGNHDLKAGDPPSDLAIRCVSEPYPFAGMDLRHTPLEHEPAEGQGSRPGLAGHVHPAIWLGGEKVACFAFGPSFGLLPAFGGFTGTKLIRVGPGWRCFAVGPGAVVPLPSQVVAAQRPSRFRPRPRSRR
jgi:DNA ligase-associated metallophosphoesterase